jgi:hypothetical protein
MNTKTKVTISFIILVAIVIVLMMMFPSRNVEAPITSNIPVATHGYDSIPYTFKKDDAETDTTSIHITQPVISGLSSKIINDAVNSQLDAVFADFKKSFIADTSGVEVFSKDTKHQLTVNGGAPLVSSDKVFYVDAEVYSYFSGAAHPLTTRTVFNFVQESGQLIRLQDILKRDTPEPSNTNAVATDADFKTSLSALSNLAKPKILEQLRKTAGATGASGSNGGSAEDSFEASGAAPSLDNYGVFYIHADRIEWVFGQYQVAPYVFGEVKISIPMSQLAPYLAPRSYLK